MQNVVVRFWPVDIDRLDLLASSLGVTRSEALRRLVREAQVVPSRVIFDREAAELQLAADK